MSLRVGETFVPTRDQATIGALLAAAGDLGLPASVIRTTSDGVIVPTVVHEAAYPAPAAAPKKAPAKKAKSKESK